MLGSPQNRVPAVHIVGTAGKGTTAHLITRRLVADGLTVATHMSPHVYDPRERFTIDGGLPDWPTVLAGAAEVFDAARRTRRSTGRTPGYFSASIAMSWILGRRAGTDMLVVEAGIGGRFDATNVIDRADRIVVVTPVGLDHTDVLGSTVGEIAVEKATVVAGSAGVVVAPQSEPVVASVVAVAAETAGVDVTMVEASSSGDWRLEAEATAAAVEAIVTGRSAPVTMPRCLPPGRLERVDALDRLFILDGAHNATKLGGLADVLNRDPPGPVRCVIAAIGKGKDLESCALALSRLAPMVIATGFDTDPGGSGPAPRSWPARELARTVSELSSATRVTVAHRPVDAIDAALRNTDEGDVVVVTGSFFHLADVRRAVSVSADRLS